MLGLDLGALIEHVVFALTIASALVVCNRYVIRGFFRRICCHL